MVDVFPLEILHFAFVKSVRTMSASAFTTIAAFQMKLFGKTFISFGGEIIISFFDFYSFSWKCHVAKIQNFSMSSLRFFFYSKGFTSEKFKD